MPQGPVLGGVLHLVSFCADVILKSLIIVNREAVLHLTLGMQILQVVLPHNITWHPFHSPLHGQACPRFRKMHTPENHVVREEEITISIVAMHNIRSLLVLNYFSHFWATFPCFPHSKTTKTTLLLFYRTGNWVIVAIKLAPVVTKPVDGRAKIQTKLVLHQNEFSPLTPPWWALCFRKDNCPLTYFHKETQFSFNCKEGLTHSGEKRKLCRQKLVTALFKYLYIKHVETV